MHAPEMHSDTILIKKCLKGNLRAQEKLFKKYAPVMMGVCMRYIKNKMEAEEVLQEGFIKVFEKLKQFQMKGSFEGWIRRIMVNSAINYFRKNKKYMEEQDIDDYPDMVFHETDIHDTMSADELMGLIQKLPDGYRMVFNLYAIEGYSHKEVGKMMGISENTSKSQLARARYHLKNMILTNKKEVVKHHEE